MTEKPISMEKKDSSGWRSPWVRACIGLLLTVMMINVGFILLSSNSDPGLVTEEYYKYGMQQNKVDKMFRKQLERGWQVELSMPTKIEPGKTFQVQVIAMDKQGAPISGGRMELTCYRPSNASQDLSITLKEVAAGKYTASASLPVAGIWDINLLFEAKGEQHSVRRRIHAGNEPEKVSTHTMLDKIVKWLAD